MRSLVLYYSRTGTTKKIGEAIASLLKCDCEEIIDTKDRKGFFGYLSAGWDSYRKKLTKLNEIKKDPAQYDIVIVGTPVWAFTLSIPIRTYLSQNKEHLNNVKKIAFFCTMGGSGNKQAFKEMESISGKKPVALLALRTVEVQKNQYIGEVNNFISKLK